MDCVFRSERTHNNTDGDDSYGRFPGDHGTLYHCYTFTLWLETLFFLLLFLHDSHSSSSLSPYIIVPQVIRA